MKTPTRREVWLAWTVAVAADALQIALFPLFAEGFISPLEVLLDLGVCYALTRLIGWHYAFVPAFFTEALPLADLVPTWTMAVFLATRRGRKAAMDRGAPSAQPVLEVPVKILETSIPGQRDSGRQPSR